MTPVELAHPFLTVISAAINKVTVKNGRANLNWYRHNGPPNIVRWRIFRHFLAVKNTNTEKRNGSREEKLILLARQFVDRYVGYIPPLTVSTLKIEPAVF